MQGASAIRLSVLGFSFAAAAHAQVVPDAPSCVSCRIQSSLVATLQHETINVVRDVFVDSRDRYWVINHADLPTVFSPAGAFTTVFGKRGPGPQELQWPQRIWSLPSDSVAILDMDGKILIHNANLEYARTASLPVPAQVNDLLVLEWPQRVLINSDISTEARTGFPLHIADFSESVATIRYSFGSTGYFTPQDRFSALRVAVAPSTTGFWAAPRGRYAVTRWTSDFTAADSVVRQPSWFPRVSTLHSGGPNEAPEPALIGMQEDTDGMLWIFTRAASPDWRRAWSGIDPNASGAVPAASIDWKHLYHTKIEIIDPAGRRIITRHTLDRAPLSLLPGLRAAFLFEDELGRQSVRIIRFTLIRR